jgi:hypothetical protein
MPTEGLAVEDKPEKPVGCDHHERHANGCAARAPSCVSARRKEFM